MSFSPVIVAYRETRAKPFEVIMEGDLPKRHFPEEAEATIATYMKLHGERNVLVLRQVFPQITHSITIPSDESE